MKENSCVKFAWASSFAKAMAGKHSHFASPAKRGERAPYTTCCCTGRALFACHKKGFSLVEILVVIFAFGLAMAMLGNFILSSYRAYNYNFQQIAAINEARRGVETMVKEIREAKFGDDGSYPLVQAGDLQFIFYSDIDRDSATERVRYFLEGSNLKKGVVEPSGDPPQYDLGSETVLTLSQYVRNAADSPIFVYYNGDWPADTVNNPLSTLTRLSETKLMHVYLKINVDPNRPPDNFELESDTQIRNLKTNL